jgi:O-antigen/teichoic acid export membrane protein
MNSFTRFIKSSSIFFIGNMLSKVIVLFLLPLYTAYIKAEDYGYYDLSVTYITVITSILFFDVWSTIMRYMYDSHNSEYKYKVVLSGSGIFAASSFMYIVVGIIVSCLTDVQYLFLIFLYGITNNLMLMVTFVTRGFEKNTDFAISGIINTIMMATANIIMLVMFKMDFSSLYIAAILGFLCQISYLEWRIPMIRNIHFQLFDKQLTIDMLRYTLPLCLNSVAYWLLTSYNRIVISQVLSVSDNGIFAVGNKFSAMIALGTTCFTYAWQDISFARKIDDSANGVFYSKACELYLRFLCLGAVLAIPVIKIIFPLMIDETYWIAAALVPISLITAVVSAYSTFVGNIFYAIKNTRAIFISMIVSCTVNLLLCHLLIRAFGLNGANLSILISFMVNIFIRDRILSRQIQFKTNIMQVFLLSLWLGITSVIYFQYGNIINILWFTACLIITLFVFKDYLTQILFVVIPRITAKSK